MHYTSPIQDYTSPYTCTSYNPSPSPSSSNNLRPSSNKFFGMTPYPKFPDPCVVPEPPPYSATNYNYYENIDLEAQAQAENKDHQTLYSESVYSRPSWVAYLPSRTASRQSLQSSTVPLPPRARHQPPVRIPVQQGKARKVGKSRGCMPRNLRCPIVGVFVGLVLLGFVFGIPLLCVWLKDSRRGGAGGYWGGF
ncbi:hypothetical protein BDV18DRAFT_163010 [Aspergillus unguis]